MKEIADCFESKVLDFEIYDIVQFQIMTSMVVAFILTNFFVYGVMLGMGHGSSHMLSMRSTTEVNSELLLLAYNVCDLVRIDMGII
jgi:hypothetical protein